MLELATTAPHTAPSTARSSPEPSSATRFNLTEQKTNGEATRALKRQLSDVIHRRLVADTRRREVARGRQAGTRLASA